MATSKSAKKSGKSTKSTKKNSGWKWAALATVSLATFISIVYTTMFNASITTVASEVKTNTYGVVGAVASYSVVAAAFAFLSSKLGDALGKRKMLLLGLVVFAAGALVAASASDLFNLILGWSVLMGIGSALIVTQSISVVGSSYSGKDQARANGVLGGVAVSALVLGPIAGVYVLDASELAWAFRGGAIAAVVAFALSYMLKADAASKKVKLDVNAVWLHALGKVSVIAGVLLSAKYGLVEPRQALVLGDVQITPFGLSISVTMIAVGLVLTLLAAKKTSLIKPAQLKNKQFTAGLFVFAAQSALVTGFLISVVLFSQISVGLDAKETAVALWPLAGAVVLVSFLALGLGKKFSPKTVTGADFLVAVLGLLLVDTVVQSGITSADLIPGLGILGIGLGLLTSRATNVLENSDINVSVQQFGYSLGAAVFGTFILLGFTFGLSNLLESRQIYDSQSRELLSTTLKEDVNNLNDEQLDALLGTAPEEVVEQIQDLKSEAEFDTFKTALGLMAGVALVGYCASLRLSAKK